MSLFPPAPKPQSYLGYHRILAPTAGVRVSPLCLGAMNFGEAWKGFMSECTKETAFKIMDKFYEHGGNFIDTANNYQNEESETWVGEWMAKRGNRDEIVLATKYTIDFRMGQPSGPGNTIHANSQGNSAKSLHVSVNASLKKLQTDYIDLLYVHWWDFTTSIPEVMQSLNYLVQSRKVLYLAISDTPAWIVAKANQYARDHGLAQFSVFQGLWSAANRDMERDIVPMTVSEGMGLAPWGVLGRGMFKTKEQREKLAGEGRKIEPDERAIKITEALEKIAKAKNTQITSVALAYIMHKTPYVYPIIGGRTVEQLEENIGALSIELSQEDMNSIEAASPWDPGFPNSFIFGFGGGKPWSLNSTAQDITLVKTATRLVVPEHTKPITPSFIDKSYPQ